MVTAQVTVTVAIIVQRQAFATDRAFVSVEAEVATGVETLSFSEGIGFLEALRALLQNRLTAFHRRDMAFGPKTLFKRSLYDLISSPVPRT